MYLVGFTIRNLSRCTVTRCTSLYTKSSASQLCTIGNTKVFAIFLNHLTVYEVNTPKSFLRSWQSLNWPNISHHFLTLKGRSLPCSEQITTAACLIFTLCFFNIQCYPPIYAQVSQEASCLQVCYVTLWYWRRELITHIGIQDLRNTSN